MFSKLTVSTLFFILIIFTDGHVIKTREIQKITKNSSHIVNNRPIIGILSQELTPKWKERVNKNAYIAASYVKFVEGSGARAVPIWIGQDASYYENILSQINGVIFPGGDSLFNVTNGYADAAKHIYKIAKELNEQGDYFPILGICLGFEVLTFLEANATEHRTDCSSMKQPLPLDFVDGFKNSRLFGEIPDDMLNILQKENVTANYHVLCVTKQDLNKVNISNALRVMSTNKDWNGLEFISTLEHVDYPFYGLQFHPEKNSYEWVLNRNVPHGFHATKAGRYFADFFINEARKSVHSFPDIETETKNLIYNFPLTYSAVNKSIFYQIYYFE